MRRLTVKLSRRRESEVAEQERAHTGSRTEDRPAYAGRLQRLLGAVVVHAPAVQARPVTRPDVPRPIRIAASPSDANGRYRFHLMMIPQLIRHNGRSYD
jgi:hypothetical protein